MRHAIIVLSFLSIFLFILSREYFNKTQDLEGENKALKTEVETLNQQMDSHYLILDIDASCKEQLEHSNLLQLELK